MKPGKSSLLVMKWADGLNPVITLKLNKHLIFQSLVLSVNVHRCVVNRIAVSLLTFICVLFRDQVTVRGYAGVVVLEECWVVERSSLDSHRPSNWSEEADLLPVDLYWFYLLARRTPERHVCRRRSQETVTQVQSAHRRLKWANIIH